MKKKILLLFIVLCVFVVQGCYTCDPRPSDRFSFYLTKNNSNLFIDTSYHINDIKLFSTNGNQEIPLEITRSLNISDSLIRFSSSLQFSLSNGEDKSNFLLQIGQSQSIDITLFFTKHKVRKCGTYYSIDKALYDNKNAVYYNNIYTYQIKIE